MNRRLEAMLALATAMVVVVMFATLKVLLVLHILLGISFTFSPLLLGHVEADVEVAMGVDLLVVPLRQTQTVSRTNAKA